MAARQMKEWQILSHLASSTIRAAKERSVLTRSALAHPTLAQTVLWADTVSRSHANTNPSQPREWLRKIAREAAERAYESLPHGPSLSSATMWYSRIKNNDVEIVRPGEWNAFLNSIYHAALSPASTLEELDRWSKELAAGLIEDQRSIDTLKQRLNEILAQQKGNLTNTQSRVGKLLLMAPNEHVVAVGVVGAIELNDFNTLVSDDSVIPLVDVRGTASFLRWGRSGGRAAEFVRTVSDQRLIVSGRDYPVGPRIFLQVLVQASDSESAGNKALRVVQRLLDAYHAAHPTAILSLYSLVAIAQVDCKRGNLTILNREERKWDSINLNGVRPLEPLLPALRVNSMVRAAPATVTRASFSWVALEAAGIKASDTKQCGKALALLELRQLFFTSYRSFVRHSPASTRVQNDLSRYAEILSRRSRRLRKQGGTGNHAQRLELAALRLDTAALFHRRLSALHKQLADRTRTLIDQIGVAEGGVSYGDPSFATLGAFSSWGLFLREWRTGIDSDRAAVLHEITAGMLPTHTSELRVLGDVAGRPDLLQKRLQDRADHFNAQLAGLYSARNLHLHNGVHDVPGEVGLAQLGQSIVDAMLEIWTLWLGQNIAMSPRDAVLELSSRFDSVQSALGVGRLIEDLKPDGIAAPDWVLP